MTNLNNLNKITRKADTHRMDELSKLLLPTSDFVKELELYKLRSQIKPRRTNQMAAQNCYEDAVLQSDKKTRIINNFEGNK